MWPPLADGGIYFGRIDGDGSNNLSNVEKYREQHLSVLRSGLLRELILPYPGTPVTVAPSPLMAIQITEDVRARDGSPVKYWHSRRVEVGSPILIVILFVGASSSTMIAFSRGNCLRARYQLGSLDSGISANRS